MEKYSGANIENENPVRLQKEGYNHMDISDIEGTRPKKHFVSRTSQKNFGQLGA